METNNQNKNNNKNQNQNRTAQNKNNYPVQEEIKEDKNPLIIALVCIIALLGMCLGVTILNQPKPVPLINQVNNLYNTNQDSWEEIKEIKAIFNGKYRKK